MRQSVRASQLRKCVQMLADVEYRKIDDEGFQVMAGGESRLLQVDHVITCAGQDSLFELVPRQTNVAEPRFHLIGGAALAAELDAKRAIREGAELASSL
jgi:2,4-dienoyl-CoA reductase (NADPH2)